MNNMTKQQILDRAKEIMKREKVDAEKAWALAVAELTIEEQKAAEVNANQKAELEKVIKEGHQVVRELKDLHQNLEQEINEETDAEKKRLSDAS